MCHRKLYFILFYEMKSNIIKIRWVCGAHIRAIRNELVNRKRHVNGSVCSMEMTLKAKMENTSAQIRFTHSLMALGRYSGSSYLLLLLSSICCRFICWLTACWLHSNWRPIVLTISANSPHDKIVIKFVSVQHVSTCEPRRGTGQRR